MFRTGLRSLVIFSELDSSLDISAVPFGLEHLAVIAPSRMAASLLLASSPTLKSLRLETDLPSLDFPLTTSFPRLLTLSAHSIGLRAAGLLLSSGACPSLTRLSFVLREEADVVRVLFSFFVPLDSSSHYDSCASGCGTARTP